MNLTEPIDLVALRTVADSCHVARAVQQDLENIRQITKDDRSPVTVADYAVQAIVCMALREADQNILIVGEERADMLRQDDQRHVLDAVVKAVRTVRPDASETDVLDAIDHGDHDGTAARYWTLDPVDGTKGFLRGQQYAVALARIEQGHVVVGFMGCPNLPVDQDAPLDVADPTGVMYVARRGDGAWELAGADPDATPRLIRTNEFSEDAADGFRSCESVEKAHTNQSASERILSRLGNPSEPARLDSQCKYAVVARGQADAYLRLPTKKGYVEKIWDHAAGMIIAEEAGATVTDITGAPLDFGHGPRLEANRGVVCTAAALHGRIINAIDELGIGAPV